MVSTTTDCFSAVVGKGEKTGYGLEDDAIVSGLLDVGDEVGEELEEDDVLGSSYLTVLD